jgi:hypothetical protein
MMHWQKLAVAGIAALGATALAAPVSAAPSGLQTLEFAATSAERPELLLVDHGRRHNRYYRKRFRDDDDINLSFGVFPFLGYGGYPYRHHYVYDDDYYAESYLHCHGKRYWRNGKRRCTGRWHRHYY